MEAFDKYDANTEYYHVNQDPFSRSFDIFKYGEKNIYDSPVEFIVAQLILSESSLQMGTYLSKLFPEYEKGIKEICNKYMDKHWSKKEYDNAKEEFSKMLKNNVASRSGRNRNTSGPDF